LLMSQYDVRGEVSQSNPNCSFLPKPMDGRNLLAWAERELMTKVRTMVARQYGFVIMPFNNPESDAWYRETLAPWVMEAGYSLRRMDEISTTKAINVELLNRIKEAHFVVAYVPRANPNVYFETGYACALDKFLLLFAPSQDELPFDIRANRIFRVSDGSSGASRQELLHFMEGLRGIRSHETGNLNP